MAIRINGATLTPNPVDTSAQYILTLELEEYLLADIGLYDNTSGAVYDNSGGRLYVKNNIITAISYISAYTAAQMDAFISSVLGV
jgi:hypothetical protein